MIKRGALRAQTLDDLAQALQPGKLGEQQRLEVALAGPGIVAAADPMIALILLHRAGDDPTIQWFQKTGKCATRKRHGRRLPGMMFGNTIPGRKTARRLLCTLTHPQNPGQQWAKAGIHRGAEKLLLEGKVACGTMDPGFRRDDRWDWAG